MTERNTPSPPPENTPGGSPIDLDQLAIALRYNEAQDPAPRVVATGRGHIAEQILNIAFAEGVKVRKDADLAQLLSVLEVDSLIPLEAYTAVAEILAYVYRANAGASRRSPPPEG